MSKLVNSSLAVILTTALFCLVFLSEGYSQVPSDNLLLSVIPHRTAEEIRADLDHAGITARLAQERLTKAQTAYAAVEARIEAKKQELSDVSQRLKTAKKTDGSVQVVVFEAKRNAVKQVLELLESRKDLRKSEVEAAEVANELANATQFALELELELGLKRVEQESLLSTSATALTLNTISQTVRAIEGKCLEAQREETKKTEQLASKEKRVIERRLKLFDLQGKVLGAKR